MPVLDAVDVWKSYGDGENLISAVRQANVMLGTGEFVALVGPSGCGKSTLLHLCGAMDRPTRGTIRIGSQLLEALDDDRLTRLRREHIGFVFQFFNLLPTLTVEQNIALPLLLAGQSEAAVFRKVRVLAERVGLSARIGHFPQQLSGGEAQRAAIARAIIHQPALLIADEPTGNLDSENGAHVLKLLRELNAQVGTAVLMATHDERVAAAADRVIQMRDGAVVGDGFVELRPRG
jgi:putative ABC transport system ATP-binding protein